MEESSLNTLNVHILGQSYTLRGEKSPAEMQQVADYLNNVTQKLQKQFPQYSSSRIAILASLQFAEELLELRNDYQELCEALNGVR